MSFTVHPLFQASGSSVSFSPKAAQGSLGAGAGAETASALFKGASKSAGTDTKDASASANAAFQKNLSLFAESERGANGEAARGPYDKDGAAAIDTLATLGFTKAVYGDAFSRYASTLSFK